MRWPSITSLYIFVLALSPVLSVDRKKFRRCAQGSFCHRYRKYINYVRSWEQQNATRVRWTPALDPDSVTVDGHIVRADVMYVGEPVEMDTAHLKEEPGAKVEIHSLDRAPHLNGKRALLGQLNEQMQTYYVTLENGVTLPGVPRASIKVIGAKEEVKKVEEANSNVKKTISPQTGIKLGMKLEPTTARVSGIVEGGLADKAGVKIGWVATEIDGEPLTQQRLMESAKGTRPFDMVFDTQVPDAAVWTGTGLDTVEKKRQKTKGNPKPGDYVDIEFINKVWLPDRDAKDMKKRDLKLWKQLLKNQLIQAIKDDTVFEPGDDVVEKALGAGKVLKVHDDGTADVEIKGKDAGVKRLPVVRLKLAKEKDPDVQAKQQARRLKAAEEAAAAKQKVERAKEEADAKKGGKDHPWEIARLSFEVGLYRDAIKGSCGIIRLTLNEKEGKHPRFRPTPGDVVMENMLPDKASVSKKEKTADASGASVIAAAAPGNCVVTIKHDPFEIEIAADGRTLQRLNGRHLLNFEQYREKPRKGDTQRKVVVDAVDIDSNNSWVEHFDGWDDSKPRGPAAVGIDVSFTNAPVVTGLGEHASRLHLGPQKQDEPYRLFNLDVFEYMVDSPMALYGIIPLLTALHHWPSDKPDEPVGSSASGFMIVNPSEGFVKVEPPVNKTVADANTWWLFESGVLDMFAFVGPTNDAVLQQYHTVTGFPRMPPLFSLGKHQSRWNYIDVKDVLNVDAGFDTHRIPYDVIWLDLEHTDGKKYFTWHPKHFADAGQMLEELERKGRNLVTIVDPHLKLDERYEIWRKLDHMGAWTRNAQNDKFVGFCWPGDSTYPDFCNPAVRDAWAKLFHPDIYNHSRSNLYIWNDMNEPSVFNGPEVTMPRDNLHKCASFSDKKQIETIEHRDMHNLYGMYHHAATVQGQVERSPNQRPFVLTRAFYAGTHRHGPVWTGDNMASWPHLARSVPMLLTLSMCGLSFSGADVGGFNGNPDPELLQRWHQLGIWYPFYRAHAHLTTKRREPWLMGPKVTDNIRDSVLTRYQLMPMWYTLMAEWVNQGLPILRPMWYNSPTEWDTYNHVDNHFLVGQNIIVRTKMYLSDTVEVYLPTGKWFDFYNETHGLKSGGSNFTIPAHPKHVPVYARDGRIICMKMRPRRSTAAMERDPYTIVVYGNTARGHIYVDDGKSYDFQDGAYIYDELEFDGTTLTSRTAMLSIENKVKRPPAVPESGLRVERVRIVGLAKKPVGARAVSGQGSESRELEVTTQPCDDGSWVATIRNPAVQIGPPNQWSVTLSF